VAQTVIVNRLPVQPDRVSLDQAARRGLRQRRVKAQSGRQGVHHKGLGCAGRAGLAKAIGGAQRHLHDVAVGSARRVQRARPRPIGRRGIRACDAAVSWHVQGHRRYRRFVVDVPAQDVASRPQDILRLLDAQELRPAAIYLMVGPDTFQRLTGQGMLLVVHPGQHACPRQGACRQVNRADKGNLPFLARRQIAQQQRPVGTAAAQAQRIVGLHLNPHAARRVRPQVTVGDGVRQGLVSAHAGMISAQPA